MFDSTFVLPVFLLVIDHQWQAHVKLSEPNLANNTPQRRGWAVLVLHPH